MDSRYTSLSLEEKTKFKEMSQNYKYLVKRIREEIFPNLDRVSAVVQDMKHIIETKHLEHELVGIKGLEVLAYFDQATEAKKEIEEDIIRKIPYTSHGTLVCNQCEIRSAYLIDQEVQPIRQSAQTYHCELCERTGPMEEILTAKEVEQLL